MSWNSIVSTGAWDDLVARYKELGGEEANDFELAELLRTKISEVEG